MAVRLSPAQIDELAELRESGLSYVRIAKLFGERGTAVSWQAVRWQCMRLGVVVQIAPNARKFGGPPGFGRAFTPEEDARLIEMATSGTRYAEIATALGRPRSSIYGRLYTLAQRDELGGRLTGRQKMFVRKSKYDELLAEVLALRQWRENATEELRDSAAILRHNDELVGENRELRAELAPLKAAKAKQLQNLVDANERRRAKKAGGSTARGSGSALSDGHGDSFN